MGLYKQNINEEENKQTNVMKLNSNDNKDKLNFIADMSERKRDTSILMLKRESYRSQIRREYLKVYFEKKRVQFFGWRPHEQTFSHKSTTLDIQIDNHLLITHLPSTKALQPLYSNNYFKGVILLQRFISEQQQRCFQDNQQSRFRYKSFYSFLISIIEENLDPTYFQQQFTNQNIFKNHFNLLKNVLYSKLVQEMEDFLIQVQQFNITVQKQNAWAYQQILLETYQKLIWQITSFLKCHNIDSGKKSNWPVISIEQQMTVLLNMLIEVTYYDEIQSEDQKQSTTQNDSIYQKAYQKLSIILSSEQKCHYQSNFSTKVNMTRMLIQNTDLINILKFFIVFGQLDQDQDPRYDLIRKEGEIRRRQRMVCLIMVVLRNVAINIGSDVLFEEGVVAELKCLLTEPLFKVQIRRHTNSNNNPQHYPFQIGDTCSSFHYKIQHFLILSFQMIKSHKTQQYLSQLDSFQFTFDVLQHINSLILQQKDIGCSQYERHEMHIQIGGQIGLFQIESNKEGIQRDRSQYNGDNDQKEVNEMGENKVLNKLIELAQSCIECIKFHFYLGEIKLQEHYQIYHYNTLPIINGFSTRNRYIIKFNSIPDSQKVLIKFSKGQQLLNNINHY